MTFENGLYKKRTNISYFLVDKIKNIVSCAVYTGCNSIDL